ncbi:hypothetical protein J4E91_000172 [Alternaria rosae]|nr:hypothetical protein J4E91_000172 [Alternaria rosae]
MAEEKRPLDRSPYYVTHSEHLDRVLSRPQLAGGIVACVMYTITEMVACRPLTGALIDLPHTFLDPACGFAIASMYGCMARSNEYVTLSKTALWVALIRVAFYKVINEL